MYRLYFITRLFVREGFYDHENVIENVPENVPEKFSVATKKYLSGVNGKKKETAIEIIKTIASDNSITIAGMSEVVGITDRTIKRYLKEFKDAGIIIREGSDISGKWILPTDFIYVYIYSFMENHSFCECNF